MTTIKELCNVPDNQPTIMEMFKNGEKVAEQNLSSMTCREIKWLIEYQEEELGRAWSYKIRPYPYAIFTGMQEDVKDKPMVPLYNIIGGPNHGSTVGVKTLMEKGIKIPHNHF